MTIYFDQNNKESGKAKMKRLVCNQNYGTIGFCNFMLFQRFPSEFEENQAQNYSMYDDEFWVIEASSNYHSEETMKEMYKTNGKEW